MEPTLLPGDRLIVVPALRRRPGDLVAARDPRSAQRLIVKRIASVGAAGIELRGDNETASTDSRQFGPVARRAIVGRAVYRYAPADRSGRLPTGR
jgi:nickel-type superoxide dismutase maturation protease